MTTPFDKKTPRVPARYYVELPHLLSREGINPQQVFDAAGIPLGNLSDPQASLELADVERLVSVITQMGGQDHLALKLGKSIHLRDHNLVGYAILSSPNIDYALRMTSRFFRLIFPAFRMNYRVFEDRAEVRFMPTISMSPRNLAFHIELISVAAHYSIEEMHHDVLPPYDLEMSISTPIHAEQYRRIMPRTRISFDRLSQPGMRLTLPLSVIHTKPMMANSESLKVAEEQCRVLLEKIFDTGNIGDWARMMLRESSDGLPSIEELAGALNISTRTLHRHLKNEGLVYRSLCVEERERRAKELLCSTRLSVTRIALELGYSDASNFTRRFKELTGHTPNAYREKYGT